MKKILAIVHDIHAEITDETIYQTLEKHFGKHDAEKVRFKEINIKHGDNSALYWQTLKAQQEQVYEDEIMPKLKEDPERKIVYFGLAPIPLCLHLGFLIGGIADVTVFLHHHDQKNWHWSEKKVNPPIIENLPQEKFDGEGNIVIRYGTYMKINPSDTHEIIEKPIRSIDVYPEETDRDLLGNTDDAGEYAKVFFNVLKGLTENLPEANDIHLFAAIPCGLAFLMGTEIQPNVHKPIVIYHYDADLTPSYIEAFCIQEKGGENLVISDEEKIEIDQLRDELEVHFKKEILFQLKKQKESDKENWFQSLFPKIKNDLFTSEIWNCLDKIDNTPLAHATFTKIPHDEGQNKFFINGKWFLPDSFLFGLKNKFERPDLERAIRLFWFHEGIHVKTHGMHSDNSRGMGRYANVLEDADYQSDVYAMLHEFKVSEKDAHDDISSFFADLILIAIETMMVFDAFSNSDTMETRRVKRYLIWFFQLARIEHSDCQSLEDVFRILALKPQLDMKLPLQREEQNRVHFNLKRFKKEEIGIAFFYKGHVKTFAYNDGQLSLDQLVEGLYERETEPVKMVMRQILGELKQLDK